MTPPISVPLLKGIYIALRGQMGCGEECPNVKLLWSDSAGQLLKGIYITMAGQQKGITD